MKKVYRLFIVACILVCMLILNSCQSVKDVNSLKPNDTTQNTDESVMLELNAGVSAEANPSGRRYYNFSSLESLQNTFVYTNTTNIIQLEKGAYGETYEQFVNYLIAKDALKIPCSNGDPMLKGESITSISLWISEWMGLPWIWYSYETIYVKISYPRVYHENLTDTMTTSQCIKTIYPTTPNIDNKEEFPHYKAIYEQEIQLSDRKVMALVYEFPDDPRLKVNFMYDDVLVNVCGTPERLTEYFWSTFSLEN